MTVSSDGYLTAVVHSDTASVLLIVNFTGATGISAAHRVTVTRTTSADPAPVTVRGLDAARAPGGITPGFDHEAPGGQVCTYVASCTNVAGTVIVTSSLATATVDLPFVAAQCWLKSLATPALSMLVSVMGWPAWAAPIGQSTSWVIGRENPVVRSDVRGGEAGALVVKLRTSSDVAAMLALTVSSGPYLLQAQGFAEPDRYVSIAATGRSRLSLRADDVVQPFSLPLQVVDRPATPGARVAIPGHTLADSARRWPTLADRAGTLLDRVVT